MGVISVTYDSCFIIFLQPYKDSSKRSLCEFLVSDKTTLGRDLNLSLPFPFKVNETSPPPVHLNLQDLGYHPYLDLFL